MKDCCTEIMGGRREERARERGATAAQDCQSEEHLRLRCDGTGRDGIWPMPMWRREESEREGVADVRQSGSSECRPMREGGFRAEASAIAF